MLFATKRNYRSGSCIVYVGIIIFAEKTMGRGFIFIFAAIAIHFSLQAQKPQATETQASVTVYVHQENKGPEVGEVITFTGQKAKRSYTTTTGIDGKGYLLLPEGDVYEVKYRDIVVDKTYANVEIPSKEGRASFEVEIIYEPAKKITLDNVYFDFGKATIKPESYQTLNDLVDYMKRKKNIKIEIAGHTDNVGGDDANLKLSQSRAESVRNYLISKGVEAVRITAKGYGETMPVESNDTEGGRAKNRRTEVKVLN